MASLLARTRIVSRLNTSVTKPLHNLACAATLSQSCSPAQRTLATLSRAGLHKQALLAPTHTILRGSYHQRLNSTSAAAVPDPVADTTAPSTSTSELKIHNPQYDEAGKELTVIITDNAVKVPDKSCMDDANSKKNVCICCRVPIAPAGGFIYIQLINLVSRLCIV